MDDGPNPLDAATRAAPPMLGKRDGWLEQRLGYLIGEQARLKGGAPLEALFAGGHNRLPPLPAYGRPRPPFSLLARRIQAVSAGLERLERGGADHEDSGFAPDGPDPGRPWVVGLTDRAH
jgi:hypothetical protein